MVYNFKIIPSASLELLKLNQDHASKILVFLVKSYKIEVTIASLIKNARVTKLWSHDHIYSTIWVTW